jgi:nucleotide-binding universal stress UspA family protein
LLATDGSLASVAATLRAVGLARERGTELHVVHVTTPESDLQVEFGEASLDAMHVRPIDGLEAARYLSTQGGVPVRTHELRGSVVDSILKAAERLGAETLVLGETGSQGLKGREREASPGRCRSAAPTGR